MDERNQRIDGRPRSAGQAGRCCGKRLVSQCHRLHGLLASPVLVDPHAQPVGDREEVVDLLIEHFASDFDEVRAMHAEKDLIAVRNQLDASHIG